MSGGKRTHATENYRCLLRQLKHLRTQLDANKGERERLEQAQQVMQQELQAAQAKAQQLGRELSERRSQDGGAAPSDAYVTLMEEVMHCGVSLTNNYFQFDMLIWLHAHLREHLLLGLSPWL